MATVGKFSMTESINVQMEKFTEMRTSDPVKSREVFIRGEKMAALAANGELRKLRELVTTTDKAEILFYFAIKTFRAALLNGYLMIAEFIIEEGYPLEPISGLPNPLHECLEVTEDYRALSICEFLIAAHKVDVNLQADKTWLTPLHISIRRGLIDTAKFLITNGADVNAVADGDVMPLALAETLPDSKDKDELISLLTRSGARTTWRTSQTSTGAGKVMKSFSGGGGMFHSFSTGTENSSCSTNTTASSSSAVSTYTLNASISGTKPTAGTSGGRLVSFRGGAPAGSATIISPIVSGGGSSSTQPSTFNCTTAGTTTTTTTSSHVASIQSLTEAMGGVSVSFAIRDDGLSFHPTRVLKYHPDLDTVAEPKDGNEESPRTPHVSQRSLSSLHGSPPPSPPPAATAATGGHAVVVGGGGTTRPTSVFNFASETVQTTNVREAAGAVEDDAVQVHMQEGGEKKKSMGNDGDDNNFGVLEGVAYVSVSDDGAQLFSTS